MEVKGLDELERQLMALGEKVATKVLRDAGREALKDRRGRYEAACRL